MKKIRQVFFVTILVLLHVLSISGCNSPSSNNVPTRNGTFFWGSSGGGRYILFGLIDPSAFNDSYSASFSRAAFPPQNGYWYAVWLVTEADLESSPVSMGKISVAGDRLTFSPFSGMNYIIGDFNGTLNDWELIMDKIPGISVNKITLQVGGEFNFYPEDPDHSFPVIPYDGDNYEEPINDKPTSSVIFTPGRYVSDVIFLDRPSVSSAYEGFPVDLTGMRVEISYNNGEKVIKTAANASEFIVDPPVYETTFRSHSIRYIAEYNNPVYFPSHYSNREFRPPANNPSQNSYFYQITDPGTELAATLSGTLEYFEADSSYDFSGISVKANYSTGEKIITPTAAYTAAFIPGLIDESQIRILIGTKFITVPVSNNKVYPILKVEIAAGPNFINPIIFDDPRFYSMEADFHWLSKMNDASFRLTYTGTAVIKTIGFLDAYIKGRLSVIYPDSLDDSSPKLAFIFHGDSLNFDLSQVVPVYNRLASISVVPLVGSILLKGSGPLPPDDEQSFLRQVKISAVYQMGSNKNAVVTRENILIYPNTAANIYYTSADASLINNPIIETNVNINGILNSGASSSYDNKGRLSKAIVTFTSTSVGSVNYQSARSATIEVGVTGY